MRVLRLKNEMENKNNKQKDQELFFSPKTFEIECLLFRADIFVSN